LDFPWNLALIAEDIVDFNLFYRGGELLFPLYSYTKVSHIIYFTHF
jgi:hypothetical protein